MRISNYDKYPATRLDAELWQGWDAIKSELARRCASSKGRFVVVVECYQGVYHDEIEPEIRALSPACWINTCTIFKSPAEIEEMTYPYVTDDRLFGFRSHFTYADFMDKTRLENARHQMETASGLIIVYGHGAAMLHRRQICLFILIWRVGKYNFVLAGTKSMVWELRTRRKALLSNINGVIS